MQVNTNISNVIDGNADKSKYDTEVKKVLSDPQILAWILKHTTKEFKEYSIEQIIGCIDGKPEVGTKHVRSGHYTKGIESLNTEDSAPGERKVIYDIRFRVVLPNGNHVGMIINVEAQKNTNPGYDIVTRGIYYCARMLSAQMGNDISAKEYDELQKVYSIWICMNVPQKSEHSMVRYQIRPEEKKKILRQGYNIAISVELEGGLVDMCNLSEAIAEKNLAQGIEQGIIMTLISLVEKGRLTKEEAAEEANMEVKDFEKLLVNGVR